MNDTSHLFLAKRENNPKLDFIIMNTRQAKHYPCDPAASLGLMEELGRKLAQDGMGVIIISDDIPEVLQTCSRVLIMKKGRIVEEHLVTDLTEQSLAAKLSES